MALMMVDYPNSTTHAHTFPYTHKGGKKRKEKKKEREIMQYVSNREKIHESIDQASKKHKDQYPS
jgi:hypothetical protein